jgi:hypothetical protein
VDAVTVIVLADGVKVTVLTWVAVMMDVTVAVGQLARRMQPWGQTWLPIRQLRGAGEMLQTGSCARARMGLTARRVVMARNCCW